MKAIVNHVSESGKVAILAITTSIGPIQQRISGNVLLPEGHSVVKGQKLDIPATKVRVEQRLAEDTGRAFDWLIFE